MMNVPTVMEITQIATLLNTSLFNYSLSDKIRIFYMYGLDILCGISKDTVDIQQKIYHPEIEYMQPWYIESSQI